MFVFAALAVAIVGFAIAYAVCLSNPAGAIEPAYETTQYKSEDTTDDTVSDAAIDELQALLDIIR